LRGIILPLYFPYISQSLDKVFKIIFWLRIFIVPTLIGIILGLIAFVYLPQPYGIVVGSLLAVLGCIMGIVFAEKMRKKHGTDVFISKVDSSTPINIKETKRP